MKTVVFVGPTLRQSEASSILDVIYLPPVEQGGVVTAVESIKPDCIAIIDGVFLQDLSVWHKEILYALGKGISVWGAASMGALRAVELESLGMRGVGWIFKQFMTGTLTDDDEVVLTHASAEFEYKKLSEPLVNIRATLAWAVEHQMLSNSQREHILAIAKSMYFRDRTLASLLEVLSTIGDGDPQLISVLRDIFANHYVDIKKEDAKLLLQEIREDTATPHARHQFEQNEFFQYLYENDRKVNRRGTEIDLSSIVRFASLHDLSFEDSRFNAFNRHIVVQFAEILGINSNETLTSREAHLFRAKHKLEDEQVFNAWIRSNDLSDHDFHLLMSELAVCRLVHTWWLSQVKHSSRKTRTVLDQLRLEQRYESAAEGAKSQQELLGPPYKDDYPGTLQSLFEEQRQVFPVWPSIPLELWISEVGYLNGEDLRRELGRSKAWRDRYRDHQKPMIAPNSRGLYEHDIRKKALP
jgi:hypothetical protein